MAIFEVKVSKKGDNLLIKYQLSAIEIPLSDITDVLDDDTYGGEEKAAFRIGSPYGHTDRVVIKSKKRTYILFTSIGGMREKILSYMAA
ncbi:PH domain-containing protein [Fictibacillus phosphorivorans]|uniref:PH domain-containing protein n=1 Tax=Fictibacillus phosphorivorans TaxID=1221500 RepID=UPI00203FA84E|nr:PH domain-containing protein [Fictibacillus phosphorivorans]MCM3718132.1 PH domain-containing protein [Fictibacillus phosphorivorans]MCM3775759.1 PH domain-containing protein [Fictibacillus phosphorivorans]